MSSDLKIIRVNSSAQSLTEICLDNVLKYFDRFNTAFLSTEDPCLRKNLFFLQRVYSEHFLKKLTSTEQREYCKCLDRKYFDLLINEHLKKLNTTIFHKRDWEEAVNVISKMGHAVVEAIFDYCAPEAYKAYISGTRAYLEEFIYRVFPLLPNATSLLMYPGTNCNDDTLKKISSSCKALKKLRISCCSITGEGLKHLCSCLELKSLSLDFIRGCDDGVIFLLKNLPSLEEISYDNLPKIIYNLHEKDLQNNSLDSVKKYNLTSLRIAEDAVDELGFDFFTNLEDSVKMFEDTLSITIVVCPYLAVISIPKITKPSHLCDLSRFSNLTKVKISNDHIQEILDVNKFLTVSGKKLKDLDLENFEISVPVLIENCPKLESLQLSQMQYLPFAHDEVNILKQPLINLEKLVIDSINMSCEPEKKSMDLLLNCIPNLEQLFFKFSNLEVGQKPNSGFEGFCEKSTTLQEVSFDVCSLDEALLHHIVSSCSSLKKLAVTHCSSIDILKIERLHEVAKACCSSLVISYTLEREPSELFEDMDYQYEVDDSDSDFEYEVDDSDSDSEYAMGDSDPDI